MKKSVLALTLCLLLGVTSVASAANFYLIPDSNTRELKEDELWGWTYEALGFVLNEIFARHGYHFEEGGKYEEYFSAQEWYVEMPPEVDNAYIYDNEMSDVELENEQVIKEVRKEMRRMGTVNAGGMSAPELNADGAISQPQSGSVPEAAPQTTAAPSGGSTEAAPQTTAVPSSDSTEAVPQTAAVPQPTPTPEPWIGPYGYELHFEEMILDSERNLKVYSGPGEKYYRGANGKASVSTNDVIYVAGWEGDWLLVKYWTNAGPSRVGYVHKSGLTGKVDAPELELEYRQVMVIDDCTFSDDPEFKRNLLGELKVGDKVTFLGAYLRNRQWAYIETKVNGKLVRGFVSANNLSDIEE